MDVSQYFDYAATGPMRREVLETFFRVAIEDFGNAHSLHAWGTSAREHVEQARSRIATALSVEPEQIFFTSGATEANNWALQLFPDLQISPFEHSSLRVPALHKGHSVLRNSGYSLEIAGNCPVGVMAVNNETGAILSVPHGTPRFIDLTQAIGKVPVDLEGAIGASFSVHKFGGPKGIGVLYLAEPWSAEAMIQGGGQENGLRGGTLNVPSIVAAAEAVERAVAEASDTRASLLALRQLLLDELQHFPDWHTDPVWPHSPAIVSLTFADVLGEALVIELDRRGFAISSGAACSSHSEELSPTLLALGYSEAEARGTVRISFGPTNTQESTANLATSLRDSVEILRNRS